MVMRKVFRNILIGAACLAVPAAVIGGHFGMAAANPYYKFYRTPITGDPQGFISAYLSAQYLGAKVIVAPGFTHKAPIEALYKDKADKVKDLGFILLDEAVEYQINEKFEIVTGNDKQPMLSPAIANTASITFRADLGSVQTGIAVAQFLNDNVDVFGRKGSEKLTFGMYGGLPFSSVTSFMGGMQKGIEWFNKNVVSKTNAKTGEVYREVEIIAPSTLHGSIKKDDQGKLNYVAGNFAKGFGPGDGDEIIKTYLGEPDLDVFMPIAGPQLWTAQKKIMELNKKTVLIGVDSPCEDDPLNQPLNFTKSNGDKIGNGKYVQFSSMKNLAKATDNILSIVNNSNKAPTVESNNAASRKSTEQDKNTEQDKYWNFCDANQIGGFGTIAVGDIKNGCVGVSGDGKNYFNEAIKGKETDINTALSQVKEGIYSSDANMYYIFEKDKVNGITYEGKNYNEEELKKLIGFTWYNDLRQVFTNVIATPHSSDYEIKEPLNLCVDGKPFIKKDDQADDNLIKLVLSDPTSILFDGSFAESAYKGMVQFYENNGIKIPNRKVGK